MRWLQQCNAMQCNAMSMQCQWLVSSDTDGQHTWTDHTLRVMHVMANIIRNVQSCFNTILLHEQCILLLRPCQLLCFLANLGRNVTMHLRTTPRETYMDGQTCLKTFENYSKLLCQLGQRCKIGLEKRHLRYWGQFKID